MKFGAEVYKKLSIDCEFLENRRSDSHTLLSGGGEGANGIRTFTFGGPLSILIKFGVKDRLIILSRNV